MPFPFLAPGDEHPPGYRVVERPVENGATSLYAVEHLATGRRATLQLFPALPEDEGEGPAARFLENMEICRKIEGEHVAGTLDAGVTDRVPWIVMEALPGEDLGKLVARRGALDLDTARAILRALGDALDEVHELGVVHAGLEPGVIFVGATPGEPFTVRVTGFGVARYRVEVVPLTSSVISPEPSVEWLAPEQLQSSISATTDVWALGLLAFWMLTGKSFWKEDGIRARVKEIMADPLPAASERARDRVGGAEALLPPGFDAWFARCVSRDPAARFSNGKEAVDALVDPEPPGLLLANPGGGFYDEGFRRHADEQEREATDADGKGGYRATPREPPRILDEMALRANPKGSFYDRGLRDPRRWPPLIVLVMVLVALWLRFFHR